MALGYKIPEIPESEKTATVRMLLEILQQQSEKILVQAEEIQNLKDEIARLKGISPRPKIRPSLMERHTESKSNSETTADPGQSKRKKRKKRLTIHKTEVLKPDNIPKGSKLLKYKSFIVQGIKIEPFNIEYKRAIYKTPSGEIISGRLPFAIKGHFDYRLRVHILNMYYSLHATQPAILEYLHDFGFEISSGELNRILTEGNELFHQEKEDILTVGLEVSDHIVTDDTGARHKGKNGYCTHIGNDYFAYFKSCDNKSRINFLEILRNQYTDYTLSSYSLTYIALQGFKADKFVLLERAKGKVFENKESFQSFLTHIGIKSDNQIRTATEGALIGSIINHISKRNLIIVSDDAGQFNVFIHALCWIHAERKLKTIVPVNDAEALLIAFLQTRLWDLYALLKDYKKNPDQTLRKSIEIKFDSIFTTKTGYLLLDKALDSFNSNKTELLMVLDYPTIPLSNNISENDIRVQAKRRKISAGTRSNAGKLSRDTFTSLKKTCQKLGVSFVRYLEDRISRQNCVPYLPDLIRSEATSFS